MPIDLEYLREHYARLSDEALLDVESGDLVEAAKQCYDAELRQRNLSDSPSTTQADEQYNEAHDVDPDWLDEAAEVYSITVSSGTAPAPDAENARRALESANIPCHLELHEIEEEKSSWPDPTHRWRLMVPGNLNQHATSVIERDIFNHDFEAQWRTHLEMLPDEDLHAMNPQAVFCGLFDRIERVNRAYKEELAARGLKPA